VSAAAGDRTHGWTLIYDGDCRFCRSCVCALGRWDRDARLTFVPFQGRNALKGLPTIERSALQRAMHLVAPDGATWTGAAAFSPVLRLLPWGGILAALLSLPGAETLAGGIYRIVARNRHRLGCGSTVCARGR